MIRSTWRFRVVAIAAYLLAAIVLTFPLVTRLTTYFPGGPKDQDVFFFLWNNWWIRHALVDLHTKPYFTDFIAAPFTIDLRLGTLGLLYGLLSVPFYSSLGPVAILNIQILATAALNGYAAFRLAEQVTRDREVAFIAGLLFACSPAIDFHLTLGRPSCAALWPAILAMAFSLELLERPNNRTAAYLAVALVAVALADQQAAMFGGFWLTLIALHAVVARRSELMSRHFLWRAAVAGAVALFPAYILYYKPFARTVGYTVPGASEAFSYSYPVSALWSPSTMWRVYGAAASAGVVLAVAVVRRVPALRLWLLGTAAFVLLSFGPVVGGTHIPLPFSLLRKLPLMAQFRTPYRFQIPAALGMTIAFGLTLSWLAGKVGSGGRRRVLIGALVLVVADLVAHRVVYGFEVQTMTRDPVYTRIAHDDRDCLVLEVPVGVRTGTDRIGPGEALGFHQVVHQKRLINGSTSRLPLAALAYYRASPAIMFLAGENPPPGDIGVDLRQRLVELKVGYVVVHPDLLKPDRLADVIELLRGIPNLQPFDSQPGIIAWRVDWQTGDYGTKR